MRGFPSPCGGAQADGEGRFHATTFRHREYFPVNCLAVVPCLPVVPSGTVLECVAIEIPPVDDCVEVSSDVNARANLVSWLAVLK